MTTKKVSSARAWSPDVVDINPDCLVRIGGQWHLARAGVGKERFWFWRHEAIARLGAEEFFFPLKTLGAFLDSLAAHITTTEGVVRAVDVGKAAVHKKQALGGTPVDVSPGGAVRNAEKRRAIRATEGNKS